MPGFEHGLANVQAKGIPLKIGFSGMGRMGGAMVRRLLAQGHEVVV
jgi:predicted homoserine dehydrogenase-like protein